MASRAARRSRIGRAIAPSGIAGTTFAGRNTVCRSIIARFIIVFVPQLREEPDETRDCPVLFTARPGSVRAAATAAAATPAPDGRTSRRRPRVHRVFWLEPVL